MQRTLSKSSMGIKSNQLFLKLMSRKYEKQVQACENASPMPLRTSSNVKAGGRKSTLNFSLPTMPLSQKSTSLIRLPKKGSNLLPAIAMMPEEQAKHLVQNLGLQQKRFVDNLKIER